jgi:2-polyprenyl-3-methyl-5-hydroxy-6-metoxy-1,4-benzoquinol methylase
MTYNLYRKKDKSYFDHAREDMLPFISKKAKYFLEFGCGNGAFGNLVKKKVNCFYEGIEPVVEFAELAKQNLDKVSCTTVEDFIINYKKSYVKVKYDIIVFNDVLEHLIDPYFVIENMKDLLNDEGTIVASIPNFLNYNSIVQILLTKDFHYNDSGILDKTHFRFFTKKSICRMFNEAGYEIIEINGIHQTVDSIKFKILNLLSFGYLNEFKFLQFAIVAKLK